MTGINEILNCLGYNVTKEVSKHIVNAVITSMNWLIIESNIGFLQSFRDMQVGQTADTMLAAGLILLAGIPRVL